LVGQHPLVLLVGPRGDRPLLALGRRDRVHPHPRHVGVPSADMAQGVYPNVPLNVVSVTFTKDCLPTGYEGLPLRCSVMLGLSRPISDFELAELDQIWPGLRDAHARHWLVVPRRRSTTSKLGFLKFRHSWAVSRSVPLSSSRVAESLAAGDRAEW
jgi:hypothetical protein